MFTKLIFIYKEKLKTKEQEGYQATFFVNFQYFELNSQGLRAYFF